MTPDFYASYISGSIGILIGNPLDLIKVRLQSQPQTTRIPSPSPLPPAKTVKSYTNFLQTTSSLARGTAAPILGYGALNALLFMTYNRTSSFLDHHNVFGPLTDPHAPSNPGTSNLWNIWIAGAIGGLATWIISTPTEIVKCRAQLQNSSSSSSRLPSSYHITKSIIHTDGVRGLFRGGVVTALRDSIGYGFYFWSYELTTRLLASNKTGDESKGGEAMKVLLCGGIAGVVTWGSIFPLDMVKTRVQTQFLMAGSSSSLSSPSSSSHTTSPISPPPHHLPTSPLPSPTLRTPLLNPLPQNTTITTTTTKTTPSILKTKTHNPLGAWQITKLAYRTEGVSAFWRGFGVCCTRAFIVNAVQWATYEWIMRALKAEVVGKEVI